MGVDEIKKILQKMGETVSKEEIEEVLRDLDPDGAKVLRYEDYVKANWDFWNKDSGKNF